MASNLQNVVSLLQKRIGFALVTRNGGFAQQKILNYFAKRHFTQHGIASTAEVQLMRAPPRQLLPHVQLSLLKTWGN